MKLFYRSYGTSTQHLIILHGLFGMSDNWVGIARKLAEKFTVIVPDMRNHGNSPASDEFSFECMVKDLDELFDGLKIENPILLGHSMGGKLAMKYLELGRREVSKIIIVDISMRNNKIREEHIAIIDSINNTNLDICSSVKDVEMQLRINLNQDHLVLFVLKNLRRNQDGKYEWKLNLMGIEPNLSDIVNGFSLSTRFNKETLFIKGGNSDYIQNEDIPTILSSFPQAKFETIPDAGHWVHADKPNEFLNIVSNFLQ